MFPGRRLGLAAAAWTGVALIATGFPALFAPLLAALAVLLGLVAADMLALRRLPPPDVARELPDRVWIGQFAEVVLRIRNSAAVAIRVDVIDELPADLSGTDPTFPDVPVGPAQRVSLRYHVVPRVRGDRPLGRIALLIHSPMDFLRRRTLLDPRAVLRVYPDASRYLRREALDPERTLAVLGVKPVRRAGEGMEFETLRDYVPGDDLRRLDWAASARRGRPITRVYQHERNHTVLIAMDASRLMAERCGERTKLDGAIDAALALAFVCIASGDRAGALVFDRELRGAIAPRAKRSQLGGILELLRPVQPRPLEANYGALLRTLAIRQRAFVVVFTDFVETFEGMEPLVALAKRHRVLLVALRAPVYEVLGTSRASGGGSSLDLYGRLVVDDLLREREMALARLRQLGVQTLDTTPEQVVAPVINRYLQFRYAPER